VHARARVRRPTAATNDRSHSVRADRRRHLTLSMTSAKETGACTREHESDDELLRRSHGSCRPTMASDSVDDECKSETGACTREHESDDELLRRSHSVRADRRRHLTLSMTSAKERPARARASTSPTTNCCDERSITLGSCRPTTASDSLEDECKSETGAWTREHKSDDELPR